MSVLLLLLLAIPVGGAVLLRVFRTSMVGRTSRWIALAATVASLCVSLDLVSQFRELPPSQPSANRPIEPRYEVRYHWLTIPGSKVAGAESPGFEMEFRLGVDGISLSLIVLTTVLMVSCVLISWEAIKDQEPEFYIGLLILESALIGVFCAFDLVMFYVAFEFTLVPLFFLIGKWGGAERRYAAIKFFLYTFTGSVVTLVAVVALVVHASAGGLATPTSIPDLAEWLKVHPLDAKLQIALFLAMATGFMVKVPLIPFHTWLPLAHTEAPTAGSVLLAGVLLKLGTYGLLRLCLPFFPVACQIVGVPLFASLAVGGIVYGSLCALVQRDVKKLVAYSSVAHLGFCVLGLFALNAAGISGGVVQMINHGLSTGGLFLLVGMVYERYHTRKLDDLHGLASRLPLLACAMVFISMASIGLPGLNGFIGEILCLGGMFQQHPIYAVIGATGLVLGAWYLLSMLQTVFFEPFVAPPHGEPNVSDMNLREALAILPLAALCLWIGVRPQPLLDTIKPDVDRVAALYVHESSDWAARPPVVKDVHLAQE